MQNAGGVAVFAVKVDGSAPFSYRWLHNGNAVQNDERVSGVTSEVLSIARVLKADEGNYAVVVVGDYGSIVSSNAVLMVVDPVIIEQPKSQEVVVGNNAVFGVGAEGTDLQFQWRRNSVVLEGATRSVLNISRARSEDAGSYSVLVSNVFGTVVSTEAMLTVDVPASIIEHPRSHTVAAGRNTTLAVVATGSPAPAYEWYFNGVAIPGACDASLNISDFQEGSQGEYYVLVTNVFGAVRSATAVLYLDWPVRFLSPTLGPYGLLKARLLSPADSVTVIEVSSNLTDWLPLATNAASSGIAEWRGTNHTGSTSRFYRARTLP